MSAAKGWSFLTQLQSRPRVNADPLTPRRYGVIIGALKPRRDGAVVLGQPLRTHPEGRVRPLRVVHRRGHRPSIRPSTCSRSRSRASTATTAPSSSTTTSSTGPASATSSSPDHGPTGRTTRPPSKPRTTTSCAGEGSTTATTPPPNSRSSNQLWPLVADRGNYFISTKKPVGWGADKTGHRKRLYDRPSPPLDPLLGAQILSPAQQADLLARREQLNLAELTRDITRIRGLLIAAARDRRSSDMSAARG